MLYQTTTLELVRNGERLLVDPGIQTWEVEESASDGVQHILITHADWDHVMGIGLLPEARVVASIGAAERIASGEARTSVEHWAPHYYLHTTGLERMRVDEPVGPPLETSIGPWPVALGHAGGHTADGLVTLFPDESLLVVGDHLSELEIPFVFDSPWSYRETLQMLVDLLQRHRPAHVVVGHGPPVDSERALRVAEQDLAYIQGLVSLVESGGGEEEAGGVPLPRGGTAYESEHRDNVRRALQAAATAR